jgi:trk system potassium uptake protein TrkA
MKVIILGAGQVGETIASYLSSQHHDISIVDHDRETLKKLSNTLDVQTIVGHGSHPDVLYRAGAESADMLIAVTHFDEINMVACQIAYSLFGINKKIARIRHKSYLKPARKKLFLPQNLSIDVVISPEEEVAKSIAHSLSTGGALEVVALAEGDLTLLAVYCTAQAPVVNTPLRHLMTIAPSLFITIVAIVRKDKIFFPQETDLILNGDEIYFLTHSNTIKLAMTLFGHQPLDNNHLVILGGGKIGLRLAEEIRLSRLMDIRVVEYEQKNAELLAAQIPECLVLKGDALDTEILTEVGVNKSEAVVCVTNNDKTNILAAILAKQQGACRTFALVNNNHYIPLVHSVGINSVINPRAITVSKIIQHLRQGAIRSIYSIREGFGEIIEVKIQANSSALDLTVEYIQKTLNISLLAIVRKEEALFPFPQVSIMEEDIIILLAKSEVISKVEQFFFTSFYTL